MARPRRRRRRDAALALAALVLALPFCLGLRVLGEPGRRRAAGRVPGRRPRRGGEPAEPATTRGVSQAASPLNRRLLAG